jgi:hypothetical protein
MNWRRESLPHCLLGCWDTKVFLAIKAAIIPMGCLQAFSAMKVNPVTKAVDAF